jgi:hypothetical protein
MINIKQEYVEELKKEIHNCEDLIKTDDLGELLIAIDEVIVSKLTKNYEPTKESHKYQVIYDDVYNNN